MGWRRTEHDFGMEGVLRHFLIGAARNIIPTVEQRATLVRDTQERLVGRAHSWLEDPKVKVVFNSFASKKGVFGRCGHENP